jgi:hypothetical protein
MKKKIGRPTTLETAKSSSILLRVLPDEQKTIEREAAIAGLSKSDWIREKLLGATNTALRGDLRKLWSHAKILTADGQEIAKGPITLRTPPARGVFWPNQELSQILDTQPGQILVAVIGRHHFDTTDWELCGAQIEVDEKGRCHLGQHYHFLCPLQ